MIRIQGLKFSYPEQGEAVLKDITLDIGQGETVLLCGVSGCGKSTLLRTINGMIPHVTDGEMSGVVTVGGAAVDDTPMYELSRRTGSVFQNPKSQFFNLDSDSELAFAMENAGRPSAEIRARMEQLTELFGIEHLRGRSIYEMSGGEKQILAIASACMNDPDVLVLDEPTANLDPAAIVTMQKILAVLRSQGKTIVIAEHRLSFLRELADTVCIMQSGRIVQRMSGKDFFAMNEDTRISLGLRQLASRPLTASQKPARGEELLCAKNISAAYGKHKVLSGLFFKAYAGDIIGVTGRNGAGKSTLFRLICGLQRPSGGRFLTGGKNCSDKQLRQHSCIVMQDVNFQLFGESVIDECMISSDDADEAKAEKVLADMQLTEWRESHPMALSGGQKQRLAIAAGLMQDKSVYLFDEPTSGLDYQSMIQVRDRIRELSQRGKAVFVITHDMELLDMLCSRCFFVHDGGISEIYADDGYSRVVTKLLCG